jgi:protein SCO1/2
MDHSAGSYVYDTQGKLRLFTRYGSGSKALTQDIAQLLKQSS